MQSSHLCDHFPVPSYLYFMLHGTILLGGCFSNRAQAFHAFKNAFKTLGNPVNRAFYDQPCKEVLPGLRGSNEEEGHGEMGTGVITHTHACTRACARM